MSARSEHAGRANVVFSQLGPSGRRRATEIAWVLVGQFATLAGSLLLLRVLTTLMTPSEYGRLALGLTLAALVGQTVTGGIANAIGRFRSIADATGEMDGFLRASRRLAFQAAVFILVFGIAIACALAMIGWTDWATIAAWIVPFAILSGWNAMFLALLSAARRRAVVATFSALEQWLRVPLAWGLTLVFGAGAATIVAACAVASLLVVTLQMRLVPAAVAGEGSDASNWGDRLVAFARPFTMFGLFTWMQQSSDRWSLQGFAGTQDVGTFAALYQIGYAPVAMASGLGVAIVGPVLYQRAGNAASVSQVAPVRLMVHRLCVGVLALTAIATALAGLLHEQVFSLLVGSEFRQHSLLLPWLVAAGGLFAAGQVLSLGMMAELDSRRLLMPKIITALAGIAMNLAGAAWAGVTGVAIASALFGLLFFAWVAVLSLHPTQTESRTVTGLSE